MKKKILVVDDELPLAMMMVALLTRAGFVVDAATNVEKSLRLAQSKKFDLITLDVDMPEINGFELCKKLRQLPQLKNTPVIFVSGRPTIENHQYALQLGAADFIEKPFNVKEFISRILSHLEETTPT